MLVVAPIVLSWAVSSVHFSRSVASFVANDASNSFWQFPPSGRAAGASPSSGRRGVCHQIVHMSADNGLRLPLSALSAGLEAAEAAAVEQDMNRIAALGGAVDLRALELDEEELKGLKAWLLDELGDVEAAGLVFEPDGAPSAATLGVTLVLTARRAVELDFPSIADLVAASESGAHAAHSARADLALATVVSTILEEMEAAELFSDASTSASAVSMNNVPEAQTMEEARSMHVRWAILELARARYTQDRPADWGSVDQ